MKNNQEQVYIYNQSEEVKEIENNIQEIEESNINGNVTIPLKTMNILNENAKLSEAYKLEIEHLKSLLKKQNRHIEEIINAKGISIITSVKTKKVTIDKYEGDIRTESSYEISEVFEIDGFVNKNKIKHFADNKLIQENKHIEERCKRIIEEYDYKSISLNEELDKIKKFSKKIYDDYRFAIFIMELVFDNDEKTISKEEKFWGKAVISNNIELIKDEFENINYIKNKVSILLNSLENKPFYRLSVAEYTKKTLEIKNKLEEYVNNMKVIFERTNKGVADIKTKVNMFKENFSKMLEQNILDDSIF